jgi:hypothetical protein
VACGKLREQAGNGLRERRVNELWSQIEERHQDESALRESGMWDDQARLVDTEGVIEEQVQIERAR